VKLSDFIDNLQKLVELHPELKEVQVVTSKDDEGNGFNIVHFDPSVGLYNKSDKDFAQFKNYSENKLANGNKSYLNGEEIKAVCVN
jgi:hypothetical protein